MVVREDGKRQRLKDSKIRSTIFLSLIYSAWLIRRTTVLSLPKLERQASKFALKHPTMN